VVGIRSARLCGYLQQIADASGVGVGGELGCGGGEGGKVVVEGGDLDLAPHSRLLMVTCHSSTCSNKACMRNAQFTHHRTWYCISDNSPHIR
jgi:hypothetical protein